MVANEGCGAHLALGLGLSLQAVPHHQLHQAFLEPQQHPHPAPPPRPPAGIARTLLPLPPSAGNHRWTDVSRVPGSRGHTWVGEAGGEGGEGKRHPRMMSTTSSNSMIRRSSAFTDSRAASRAESAPRTHVNYCEPPVRARKASHTLQLKILPFLSFPIQAHHPGPVHTPS